MRVTREIKAAIRRPYLTMDHMQAMAGILSEGGAHRAFLMAREAEVRDRNAGLPPTDIQVAARVRDVCIALIEWRVSMGQLCMLL